MQIEICHFTAGVSHFEDDHHQVYKIFIVFNTIQTNVLLRVLGLSSFLP